MNEKSLTLKITDKGCVGLYGLRRFPIVFYASEWQKIFECQSLIEQFIKQNNLKLTNKKDSI